MPIPASFPELLAPMTESEFFAEYHRRKPLHIKGAAKKLDGVMNWDALSSLLSQNSLWTQRSLELAWQLRKIPPQEYCTRGTDRDGRDNWLVDAEQLLGWLRRGASLVANDIGNLSAPLQQISAILEETAGGKAQANLYCSWQAHKGFGTHFDTHDVYALHVAGTKRWKVYQCAIPDPVAHPAFKGLPPEFHEKNHGPVSLDVLLEPGDILYIPRGWYHDALATSEATIHVAFGVTPVIGLDLVTQLFERAVHEPLFRAAVPAGAQAGGEKALAGHMAQLGDTLARLSRDPQLVQHFARFVSGYRYQRRQIRLPAEVLAQKKDTEAAE
ncbi:MAG: hypothetical protein GC131_02930 [Alphaproteobacteria bacterium]|nr:hypothetical protein [Alphaproteobacteria bacterium]